MQATVWLIANQQCGSSRINQRKAPESGAFLFPAQLIAADRFAPQTVVHLRRKCRDG